MTPVRTILVTLVVLLAASTAALSGLSRARSKCPLCVPIADSCTAAKPPRFIGETFAITAGRLFTGGDATISLGDTVNAAWPLSM
jgi:hypothetical protein